MRLQQFLKTKLNAAHAALDDLWSGASSESDIQRIEQQTQRLTTLQYYNGQAIETMLLASEEGIKLQTQLYQVLDDEDKETVVGIIKDISTNKTIDS